MKINLSLKSDVSPLIKLTIPLALTGLVQSAVWFFETLFLAQLGEKTLAAGSLVSWLFGTLAVILFGILNAINILVAHKHGSNDQEEIAWIAKDGLLLAIVITIPAMFLFWYMSPIFLLFGQSASVVILAQAYLHALAWGLIANFITVACLEVIIGIGHTRVILIFSLLSVTLNILCSYVLIFGKWGFPALGIAGAGWGMTVSYWISAILLIGYITSHAQYRHYFRYVFILTKPKYIGELFQVGMPLGIMYCVEVGFFFALILLMGRFGTQVQAANQVALQFLGLLMSIMFSIAQAITVRMGHLLGAREKKSAEKAAYVGVYIAAILACLMAVVYWFFPKVLIAVDFNIHDVQNAGIINDIEKILAVSAIFQIFEASRIALFGALRGIKDTKFTLITSVISFWCIALPLGYILSIYLKTGNTGYWWAMVLGACVSVFLLQWRFKFKMSKLSRI